ncbi:MAG: gamma-glutamyl-gamma-aminobutyrate hydrolase family protein [Pyrinomonadaceae bacterium]
MSKNIAQRHLTNQPRIGITMRFSEKGDFYLRREYSEAIEACGGIPLHLPLIPKKQFVVNALSELDGILLPGSDSDLDPLYYGQEPHPKLGGIHPLRDETDLLLIAAADQLMMPILGICYGMQALNVARGGTLVQDIESCLPSSLDHQQGEPRERRSHDVFLEADSLLRNLCGVNQVSVNSHHHQSISAPGQNLKIVARSTDNIIEAVEDIQENRFVLGIQWHPELDWQNDEASQKIFGSFVKAATYFKEFIKT